MDSCLVSFQNKICLSCWSCKSFDDLPDGLVVDILSRLPVKTLVLSSGVSKKWYSVIKSAVLSSGVSKKWYSVIKSASFISAHLSRSVSDPSKYRIFLLHNHSPSVIVISDNLLLTRHPDFNLPFETKSKDQTLIGACNGLLCLTDYSSDYHGHDIYLINPFIYKFKKLDVKSSCYADLIKEINYETGYIKVGFGYCEVENDYKLLRIINRFRDTIFCVVGTVKVEIYSLKSGKWKGVDVSFDIEIESIICPAFVHGCLYWLVNHILDVNEADEYLICFDLKDEVFGRIELPPTYRNYSFKWERCILDKDGSVAIVGHTIKDRNSISPFMSICLLVLEKNLFGQFQWKELRYECTDFNPVNSFLSTILGCSVSLFSVVGFSRVGRLIFEGLWDRTDYMVAVDLDNSCAVEKLELVSDDLFDRAANVLESLVLFSDSPN